MFSEIQQLHHIFMSLAGKKKSAAAKPKRTIADAKTKTATTEEEVCRSMSIPFRLDLYMKAPTLFNHKSK